MHASTSTDVSAQEFVFKGAGDKSRSADPEGPSAQVVPDMGTEVPSSYDEVEA